jgi:hypothetical protein
MIEDPHKGHREPNLFQVVTSNGTTINYQQFLATYTRSNKNLKQITILETLLRLYRTERMSIIKMRMQRMEGKCE